MYSGTKAAVNAVTRSLAQELGPRKIRVNAINPGMVETEGTTSAGITDDAATSANRRLRTLPWAASVSPRTSPPPRSIWPRPTRRG